MLGTAGHLVLVDPSPEIHVEGSTNKYYILLYYVIHSRYVFLDEGYFKLTLFNHRHTEPINGDEVHSLFEKNSHP
jgi:small-conductance mechanosensitive channel